MWNTSQYQNLTFLTRNGMQVKIFLSMTPCVLFLYVNIVMLITLRCKATFRETSRYILFGHLLFSDSIQLFISVVFYLIAVSRVYLIGYACLLIVIIGEIIASMSPLNLAVMSLERYVAVCFPLRHSDIATSRRTILAICIVWVLGSLNAVSEVIVYIIYDSPFAPMPVFCTRYTLFKLEIYVNITKAFTVIYFVSVGMIIMYTYVAILVAAKSVTSDDVSYQRANRTVLLHFIQLGLCLTSTLFRIINTSIYWQLDPAIVLQLQYVLFVVLIIFPRCLSPLIYGLRDQAFSSLFKYYFFLGLRKTVKPAQ